MSFINMYGAKRVLQSYMKNMFKPFGAVVSVPQNASIPMSIYQNPMFSVTLDHKTGVIEAFPNTKVKYPFNILANRFTGNECEKFVLKPLDNKFDSSEENQFKYYNFGQFPHEWLKMAFDFGGSSVIGKTNTVIITEEKDRYEDYRHEFSVYELVEKSLNGEDFKDLYFGEIANGLEDENYILDGCIPQSHNMDISGTLKSIYKIGRGIDRMDEEEADRLWVYVCHNHGNFNYYLDVTDPRLDASAGPHKDYGPVKLFTDLIKWIKEQKFQCLAGDGGLNGYPRICYACEGGIDFAEMLYCFQSHLFRTRGGEIRESHKYYQTDTVPLENIIVMYEMMRMFGIDVHFVNKVKKTPLHTVKSSVPFMHKF